jgi:hypothetical protein
VRPWRALVVGLCAGITACAPRLVPLTGAPAPARLPRTDLKPGHWKLVFNWVLDDRGMSGRGEGVARIASPDSVRLDFFLAGGFGAGAAVLIGDDVRTPGSDLLRRLVPAPPLLWAALGRAALPAIGDTVARADGAILRVDLGRPVAWRLTFRGDTLIRLERVEKGRVGEWVARADSAHVKYRNEGAHRSLELTVTRLEQVPEFDASIWSLPR